MSEWNETRYEHLSRLAGPVEVVPLQHLDSCILVFRGRGLTFFHGWFAKAERYVFLASREEMSQLVARLVAALQRDPSPGLSTDQSSRLEPDSSVLRRLRPVLSHSVVETHTLPDPLHRYFDPLPAVILDVEHEEERQRYFPQPVMEQAPYPFLCPQEQLLDLVQDIQKTLRLPEDGEEE